MSWCSEHCSWHLVGYPSGLLAEGQIVSSFCWCWLKPYWTIMLENGMSSTPHSILWKWLGLTLFFPFFVNSCSYRKKTFTSCLGVKLHLLWTSGACCSVLCSLIWDRAGLGGKVWEIFCFAEMAVVLSI